MYINFYQFLTIIYNISRKKILWIYFKAETQKGSLSEEILFDPMETTSNSLHFGDLTSVGEEQRFQNDIVAQTDAKLEFVLFPFIL